MTLVQKGVSNKNETIKFYKNSASGAHSLIKTEGEKESIDIQTVTLDDYFKGEEIDMMKIDVEGFELEVIEGCKKLLENNKNMKIISEFGHYYSKRSNQKVLYPTILHKMGFKLFGVVDKSIGKSKIVNKDFDELMEFYSKATFTWAKGQNINDNQSKKRYYKKNKKDYFIFNLIWK